MAEPGDAFGRLRERQQARLRWFTTYHAVMVVIALGAIGWFVLGAGDSSWLWGFIGLLVVLPAGVPLVWWANRRSFRQTMSGFEAFRSRVVDAKLSLGSGYLLILDDGVVLGMDPRTPGLRFMAFFSAGGALVHPDMAQAERWGRQVRGMESEGATTSKRGPPEAQAELERFRVAFGARWYALFLRHVKSDRMTAGDPMWHEVLAFSIPRWWNQAHAVAGQLDSLASFMTEARMRYFPRDAASV